MRSHSLKMPYQPIACDFHSVVEEAVLHGQPQDVLYRSAGGALRLARRPVEDVYAKEGAEYLRLAGTAAVRLDRVVRIGDDWLTEAGRVRGEGRELAEAVLDAATREAERVFGRRLLAAYALGSLAHGGFAPNVSDVDLGVVLEAPLQEGDAASVEGVAARIREAPMPLAGRLSIFWGSPASLRGEEASGRFPAIDRLDLLQNGWLLFGHDVRGRIPAPGRRTLDVETAQFALRRLATPEHMGRFARPRRLLSSGLVELTKAILLPARLLYATATGEVATNEAAAGHYQARYGGRAAALVREGLRLRTEPLEDDERLARFLPSLTELHAACADACRERMAARGEDELAARLARWQRRLTRPRVASQKRAGKSGSRA